VTVEAALALCSLMLVLALAIGALASVGAELRCMDAAREAARLIARGESERAHQAAAVIAPAGALIEVMVRGDEVTAQVSARVIGKLSGLVVSARAVGVLEPGVLATDAADRDEPDDTRAPPDSSDSSAGDGNGGVDVDAGNRALDASDGGGG
jgi:hypothetical protein